MSADLGPEVYKAWASLSAPSPAKVLLLRYLNSCCIRPFKHISSSLLYRSELLQSLFQVISNRKPSLNHTMTPPWPHHMRKTTWARGDYHERIGCLVEHCDVTFALRCPRNVLHAHSSQSPDFDHAVATLVLEQVYCSHENCDFKVHQHDGQAQLFHHQQDKHPDAVDEMSTIPGFVSLIRKKTLKEQLVRALELVALRLAAQINQRVLSHGPSFIYKRMWYNMRFCGYSVPPPTNTPTRRIL